MPSSLSLPSASYPPSPYFWLKVWFCSLVLFLIFQFICLFLRKLPGVRPRSQMAVEPQFPIVALVQNKSQIVLVSWVFESFLPTVPVPVNESRPTAITPRWRTSTWPKVCSSVCFHHFSVTAWVPDFCRDVIKEIAKAKPLNPRILTLVNIRPILTFVH